MLPRERLEIIKEMAREEKKVYVSELSKKFNVTEETIRRDLDKLEKQGVLIREYGGAVLNTEKLSKSTQIYNKPWINIKNIKGIAEKAINFVEKGSTMVVDCNLLTLEVLKLINNIEDVTVITNSVRVVQELNHSNINLILTGGSINCNTQSLQGNITEEVLKNYNVDIALLTCNGIDITNGISELNEAEAEIKKIMIGQAKKVILLADETIFDTISFVKLFDYEDLDCIITDKEPRKEWINLFKSYGIQIIY